MRLAVAILAALACCAVVAAARAEVSKRPVTPIRIGEFSSQISPNRAKVGAHIAAGLRRPGRRATTTRPAAAPVISADSPPPLLTLPSDSPLLEAEHPFGPGTLWYQGLPGEQCVYSADLLPLCFAVVGPSGRGVDPAVVAARVAESMDLVLPPIEASPSAGRSGLTGDVSWFWLGGALDQRSATVRLGPELVTVTADPSGADWRFGDGSASSGGPGIVYRPGPPPADAITHVYQARCLPGDQGRDPSVVASCGNDGYAVSATVRWTISFAASGPVDLQGALPARMTQSTLVYPVSEARAFLVDGRSQ